MKIKSLHLSFLRNNDHFQFHTGFKELIELLTASMLKIDVLFDDFLHRYIRENEMLDQIHKSNITDDLVEADNNRDITLSAMFDVIQSATKHFRIEVRQSATRLKSLFEQYNSLTLKSYDDQTAATNRLVEELVGKYATDVANVSLSEWVSELKIKNMVFDSLKKSRYTEVASHMQFLMKQLRSEVDTAYYAIINRINALIELEGEASYHHFMTEMNTHIESYNDILAQRRGRTRKAAPAPPKAEDINNPRSSIEFQM